MQAKFEALQAKYRKVSEAVSELSFQLKYAYGDVWRAPAGKQKRLDKLRAREDRAANAIFAWLDTNSPRDWRHGCPYHWICEELTYADAVTSGQLSVVPPLCFGAYTSDMVRFAAPLPQQSAVA